MTATLPQLVAPNIAALTQLANLDNCAVPEAEPADAVASSQPADPEAGSDRKADNIIVILRPENAPLKCDPAELYIGLGDGTRTAKALSSDPAVERPVNDNLPLPAHAERTRHVVGGFVVAAATVLLVTVAWQSLGRRADDKFASRWDDSVVTRPVLDTAGSQVAAAPVERQANAVAAIAIASGQPAASAPPPAQREAALEQAMESMTREIAALRQSLEELKAAQLQQDARRKTAAGPPVQRPAAASQRASQQTTATQPAYPPPATYASMPRPPRPTP
jgi:hypothetical protein